MAQTGYTEQAENFATELAGLIESQMDVDAIHDDGDGILRLTTGDGDNFRIKITCIASSPEDDVYDDDASGE